MWVTTCTHYVVQRNMTQLSVTSGPIPTVASFISMNKRSCFQSPRRFLYQMWQFASCAIIQRNMTQLSFMSCLMPTMVSFISRNKRSCFQSPSWFLYQSLKTSFMSDNFQAPPYFRRLRHSWVSYLAWCLNGIFDISKRKVLFSIAPLIFISDFENKFHEWQFASCSIVQRNMTQLSITSCPMPATASFISINKRSWFQLLRWFLYQILKTSFMSDNLQAPQWFRGIRHSWVSDTMA